MAIRGIDVASYQGYPDWQAVAADGYEFAITKLTEDDGYVNPTFGHNWIGIREVGLVRGAYHFARPGINDAVNEADYFMSRLIGAGLETGDLIVLDLESGYGDLGPWVLDFCHRVEALVGFSPMIYTGAWFSEPHNLAAYPEIGAYGLWLAAYQAQMPAPPLPWDLVAIWQHSSSGSVAGIDGDVDLNVFNGDSLEQLKLYGKPALQPQPGPQPGFVVGPGILAAMQEAGDRPATDENFGSVHYSDAYGTSGSHYVYVNSLNRVVRFDPSG